MLKSGCHLKIKIGHHSASYLIARNVDDVAQVGTSYKVEGATINESGEVDVHQGNSSYFLKLPDATPDDKPLYARIQAEADRGRELRQLIAESELALKKIEKKSLIEFRLPKLIASARLEGVTYGDAPLEGAAPFVGLPAILYEWVDGEPLEILGTTKKGQEILCNIRENWFDFAASLAEVMRRVHNHGMLHGSIIPRNIICQSASAFRLVGFGYSSLSFEAASEGRSNKLTDRCYVAPETRFRGLGALWNPADIYSIGALLYDLAVGSFPSDLVKDIADSENNATLSAALEVGKLKKDVRKGLVNASEAEFATASLKSVLENDNVAKIIDNCLRRDPTERLDTVEELAEAIELARTGPAEPNTSYFDYIVERKEREVKRLKNRISEGIPHDEIFRSRTIIINGLCHLINRLPKGARYCTVTLPSYWTGKNLGPDGRFLAMNRHVAKRGVKIERLFLVSGGLSSLSDAEQDILQFQQDASSEVTKKGGSMTVKVLRVPEEVIMNFERSGRSVAFVAHNGNELDELPSRASGQLNKFLSLNFISRGQLTKRYGKSVIEREIRKVRVWDPARGDAFWKKFRNEAETFYEQWNERSAADVKTYLQSRGKLTLAELLQRDNQ